MSIEPIRGFSGVRGAEWSPVSQRRRDPVAALFAAALDGDAVVEDILRELAIHDDRAGRALGAVAAAYAMEQVRTTGPSSSTDEARAEGVSRGLCKPRVDQDRLA